MSARCGALWSRRRVPDLLVEKVKTILSHVLESIQHLFGVPGRFAVDEGKVPLHRSECIPHRDQVLGEIGDVVGRRAGGQAIVHGGFNVVSVG